MSGVIPLWSAFTRLQPQAAHISAWRGGRGKAVFEVGQLAFGERLAGGFERLAFLLAVMFQQRIVSAVRCNIGKDTLQFSSKHGLESSSLSEIIADKSAGDKAGFRKVLVSVCLRLFTEHQHGGV